MHSSIKTTAYVSILATMQTKMNANCQHSISYHMHTVILPYTTVHILQLATQQHFKC